MEIAMTDILGACHKLCHPIKGWGRVPQKNVKRVGRKLSYSLLGLGVQLTDCYFIPPLGLQDINHIVPGRVKEGGVKRTILEQINIGVQDPKNGLAVRFGKIEPETDTGDTTLATIGRSDK